MYPIIATNFHHIAQSYFQLTITVPFQQQDSLKRYLQTYLSFHRFINIKDILINDLFPVNYILVKIIKALPKFSYPAAVDK